MMPSLWLYTNLVACLLGIRRRYIQSSAAIKTISMPASTSSRQCSRRMNSWIKDICCGWPTFQRGWRNFSRSSAPMDTTHFTSPLSMVWRLSYQWHPRTTTNSQTRPRNASIRILWTSSSVTLTVARRRCRSSSLGRRPGDLECPTDD